MVQALGWSARGDSNPDLHGLNVPRLPIAPRAETIWSLWVDSNHHHAGQEPGMLRSHYRGIGANDGIRTRTSRLGRPVGDRYPTFALVRPTGIAPVPPRWQRGMRLPHPGRTWTGAAHRPIASLQFSKTPLVTSWWAARDSNPIAPLGENGFTARQRTIRSYRPLATAPGFEPGPTSFGGSDASVTPRCRRHLTYQPIRRHSLPLTWPMTSSGLEA